MKVELFDKIKSEILKRHYEDEMNYSSQAGDIDWDIKRGIQNVQDVLSRVELKGSEVEVLMRAADSLGTAYKEFSSLPEVQSDKVDKYGFTCAVLKNCFEKFHERALCAK